MKAYKKPFSKTPNQDRPEPSQETSKPVETPPTTYNPTIDD